MAENKNNTTSTQEQSDLYRNVENFFLKNRNIIVGGIAVIAIAIAGYFGYQKFILEPKEMDAREKIATPQANFQKDSLTIALNGDGINPGFLAIIDNYGNTPTGNLAHYYTGTIYLKQKDLDNAILHLEKFKPKTDELAGLTYVQLGHAYADKNNLDKAVGYYKKAGEAARSDFFSPYYYKMAGDLLTVQGKYAEAKKIYELIKSNYPLSEEGQNIDKEIAYTETKLGK
ncbi:MAG: tetratricopeptide repeat protein [Chitinophagales bacterium]